MKYIIPTILIGIAVALFFTFTGPLYKGVSDLRTQIVSYNEALDNSKALEAERDKLTQKYNTIDPENLTKLQKMLPDSVDNIRLILEIEKIASPYGMTLKDVRYDTLNKDKTNASAINGASPQANSVDQTSKAEELSRKDYGAWDLEFSTKGTYGNFINFVKDLEKNLRIVDIDSVQFSSMGGGATGANTTATPSVDGYVYNFKITTYWLKN